MSFFFFLLRFCDEKHSFFDRFPTVFQQKKPPENLEIATAELSKLRKSHEKLQKTAEKHKKSAEKCEKSLESAKIALEKSEFDREKLSERGTCDFFLIVCKRNINSIYLTLRTIFNTKHPILCEITYLHTIFRLKTTEKWQNSPKIGPKSLFLP
jgi:hypothetical protein